MYFHHYTVYDTQRTTQHIIIISIYVYINYVALYAYSSFIRVCVLAYIYIYILHTVRAHAHNVLANMHACKQPYIHTNKQTHTHTRTRRERASEVQGGSEKEREREILTEESYRVIEFDGGRARYLRSMINNSRLWALERGLLQTNEVHKAEEWRIPVSKEFKLGTIKGTSSTTRATAQLEAS